MRSKKSTKQKESKGKNFKNNTDLSLKVNVKTAKGRKLSSTNWLRRQLNDPYVKLETYSDYKLEKITKLKNSFNKKDIIIIANNNPNFKKLDLKKEMKLMNKNGLVYDYWNFFKINHYNKDNKTKYISYGSQI